MRTATIQVADVVLFELKAVDDPWLRSLLLVLVVLLLEFLRFRILDDQDHPARIGRPLEGVNALSHLGPLHAVAALTEKSPDLLLLVVASG